MRKVSLFFLILALVSAFSIKAQAADNRVVFLHHSTGGGVFWEGGVDQWIADYNASHGTAIQVEEREYPSEPYAWENYPYDYWNLWINGACDSSNPNIECMDSLASKYDVVIFKHCFPGAYVIPDFDYETPDVGSMERSMANYKLQYQALRELMDSYPDTVFIVWTLAPLHRMDTDAEAAARAAEFVRWVKEDWLHEDGKAHPNIRIFDFWGLVAETSSNPSQGQANCLKYQFEQSHSDSDSHPNAEANRMVGPIFAQFIVDNLE